MRRRAQQFIVLLLLVVFVPASCSAATFTPIDVMRMVNPNNGDHYYSYDEREIAEIACSEPSGFAFEGYYSAYSHASGSILPLYRFYNPTSQRHFYTVSTPEMNYVTTHGFVSEGIVANVQTIRQTEYEQPVYRLYNAATKDHLYTYSDYEISSAQAQGYVLEGTVWWSPDFSTTFGDMSIIRMYNASRKAHFFASRSEWHKIGCKQQQYIKEGIAFKMYVCSSIVRFGCYNEVGFLRQFYNESKGIHLLTGGAEADGLSNSAWTSTPGNLWTYDTAAGVSPSAQDVYRLRYPNTGAYVLTASVAEKNAAIAGGWVYEGVAFKAEPPCNCYFVDF